MLYILTLPGINARGFLVQRAGLPLCPHRYSRSGPLSPGVRTLASTGSRVPHGTGETRLHPLKDTIKPLGENALSCEMLRWLFHRFLANTVVFLPLTLRQRTHRNAIWLSRYYGEYSTLQIRCQHGTIGVCRNNTKHVQCALTSKILRLLERSESTMALRRTMKRSGLRCSEHCENSSNTLPNPSPKQGRDIHPRLRKDGAFCPVYCNVILMISLFHCNQNPQLPPPT